MCRDISPLVIFIILQWYLTCTLSLHADSLILLRLSIWRYFYLSLQACYSWNALTITILSNHWWIYSILHADWLILSIGAEQFKHYAKKLTCCHMTSWPLDLWPDIELWPLISNSLNFTISGFLTEAKNEVSFCTTS